VLEDTGTPLTFWARTPNGKGRKLLTDTVAVPVFLGAAEPRGTATLELTSRSEESGTALQRLGSSRYESTIQEKR
jgi:hypothetical protein